MMTIEQLRSQFPILEEKVYGRPLVYLDNAATSQRPLSVVEKWNQITLKSNANLHRAVHKLAADATAEYENARQAAADFIGAADAHSIVFTSGATAALNLVAFCFGEACIKAGDQIIVTEEEHHSNIVPWQLMAQRKGAVLKVLPVDDNGRLCVEMLDDMLSSGKVRLLSVAHISNVLGIVNPVQEIVDKCHKYGCAVMVDGAQGIVHQKVDVTAMDCDFYAFSGHKLYAAPGTGVLYAKKQWLEEFPPYMGGGEMIETVRWTGTTFAKPPHKFEAGTQNISGVPTLVPAFGIATQMREQSIDSEAIAIKDYIYDTLRKDPRVKLFGCPDNPQEKIPLFSFCVDGVHHEDLALILDKMGFAVRSGQMCAEPLMDRFGVTGMLRVSFAPYNTMQEAQQFISALDKAVNMLR
ncbi:MAG: SufS family cysteine desulfurase [Bacteroidales bacterium]|nr:SufS family cysteine desulfurase [Bacteroidales bacterium]